MVRRIRRTADCKTSVESSLKALGYDTNPTDTNNLHDKECTVLYSDIDIAVYTQEEYEYKVYITIELAIDNNNEIPTTIMEIAKNVTHDVENATVPWCTSFQFSNCVVSKLGSTHVATLTAYYEPIQDWVTE